MRRWLCIIGLLAGFSGTGYVWTARPRIPVPFELVLGPDDDMAPAKGAWWNLS